MQKLRMRKIGFKKDLPIQTQTPNLRTTGFVQSLEFLKKSENLQTTSPDLGRSMEIKGEVLKNGMKSGIFLRNSRCLKAS